MSDVEQATCPSWCVVEHTWDGLEFHKSAFSTVDDFGEQIRVSLFLATGEDCAVRVLVSGGVMTPDGAMVLAHYLHELADAAVAAGESVEALD